MRPGLADLGLLRGSSAFTPWAKSSVGLWLRADAGLTAGAWTALAGSGATQGTGSKQPSQVASGIGGVPTTAFAAASSQYLGNTSFAVAAQPFTVYVVAQLADQTTDRSPINLGSSNIGYIDSSTSTTARGVFNGAQIAVTYNMTAATVYALTVNGASSIFRIAGTNHAGTLGSGGFSGGYQIGAEAGVTRFWDKWISEVIIDSDVQDAKILSYLGARYGLAA